MNTEKDKMVKLTKALAKAGKPGYIVHQTARGLQIARFEADGVVAHQYSLSQGEEELVRLKVCAQYLICGVDEYFGASAYKGLW